jgi:hypothetical protein
MSRPRDLTRAECRALTMMISAHERTFAPYELAQLLATKIREFYTHMNDRDEVQFDFGASVVSFARCQYLDNREVPAVMYWPLGKSEQAIVACWLYHDPIADFTCMLFND